MTDEALTDVQVRRLRLLRSASDSGHGSATYDLALSYAMGTGVAEDGAHSALLFRKAADQGYKKAKVAHSIDLFFGLNGMERDEETALAFVRQAIEDHVEDADIALNVFLEYRHICQTIDDYLWPDARY